MTAAKPDSDRLAVLSRLGTFFRACRGAYRTTREAGGGLTRIVLALQLTTIVALVAQLLTVRSLLAALAREDAKLGSLVGLGALLVAAFVVSTLATQGIAATQRLLAERVSAHAMGTVLEAATRVPLLDFERSDTHDRLQRALVNSASRPTQITTAFVSVVSAFGTAIAVGATVLVLAPLLLATAVLAAVPIAIVAVMSSRSLYDFAVRQTTADRRRGYLQLVMIHRDWAKEVRAYGLGHEMLTRWRGLYDARIADLAMVLRRRFLKAALGTLGAALGLALSVLVLLWLVTSGRLGFAGAATVAAALLLLSRQLQTLVGAVGSLYESALFLEDYQHFLRQRDVGAGSPLRTVTGPALRTVELRDASFTYPSDSKPALTRVSIVIGAGEIVALVGRNGSGKSTAAKLIAGLYEPDSGDALWNGRSYRDIEPSAIRRQVAVLFQDYIRYQLSVRENIVLGRPERSARDDDVHAAVAAAGATDMVHALPDGLATDLGPEFAGGTELSGGQWQRLALARAAFRGAPLVILDEPTAALDPIAEEQLFDNTREIFAGKSVVLISHRFSSVRRADRIYVLDAGGVVETGSHDELMARNEHYAQMYRAQRDALLGSAADTASNEGPDMS